MEASISRIFICLHVLKFRPDFDELSPYDSTDSDGEDVDIVLRISMSINGKHSNPNRLPRAATCNYN